MKGRARRLRKHMTDAEQALWKSLLVRLLSMVAAMSVCRTCIEARSYEPTGEPAACFPGKKEGGRLRAT